MAEMVTFDVQGLPELVGRLEGLNFDLKRKGGRFALRKAANLIRDRAKANARRLNNPATPTDISKNIAVRWSGRHFKRTGDLLFRVGVRGGARQYANTRANVRDGKAGQAYATAGDKTNPGGDTFYWRYLEFGTERMAAQPFMRPAMALNAQAAADEFVKHYGKAIDRALKKAAKAKG